MRRFFVLSVLFLLYLLFTAKSCSDREEFEAAREEKQLTHSIDSISSVFGTDTLSDAALHAFEETAKLRFTDFLDYLGVLSDSAAAPVFREHARKMIRELFRSENDVLYFTDRQGRKQEEIRLALLTDPGAVFPERLTALHADSVWVLNALLQVSDTLYAGRLGFSLTVDSASADPKKYWLSGKSIEFFAVKREKKFGNERLRVWTVLLGENDPGFNN